MPRRLKVIDVNPHVVCTICDGYLVDATAIIECLHAFCRTCIVRYLENSKFCPVCDVQVHKTKPLLSIRSDQTLQDLVYKMVPDLYQNEMQRRREFYTEHPKAASSRTPEERGEGEPRFFSPKETISLSLQHVKSKDSNSDEQQCETKDPMTRHLNCPAAFTVGHLKKFIHLKFSLPPTCEVDVFYDDHFMKDSFTLMDVAYIYSWKRAEPMKFFYSIAKRVPKCVELPPLPPPEIVPAPASEAVHSDEHVSDDVPEAPPVTTIVVDPESTEADVKSSVAECGKVENAPSEEARVDTPELDTTSSKNDVQMMDVSGSKVQINSSLSIKSTHVPLVPEPTYNSVKVVSTPEPNTLLSPTNGFRLKFIHDPELNPKKSGSKKSGRKAGRSSRHKSAPVRLARLAPYPPPATPVTCLTTPQQLSQLTVGKLVPTVITTLAPTFVTTLVSTTSNSVCNNVTNNASSVSTFLGQSPAVCTLTTPNTLLTPAVLPCTAENTVTLSSTANTITVSTCSLDSTISTVQDSSVHTKELLSAQASPAVCVSVPSTTPSSTAQSIRSDFDKPVQNSSSHSSISDTSALTNSVVDPQPTNINVPDSSLSSSPKPAAVVTSSTKDVDGSEIVTSTSGDPLVPMSAVPISHTDSDARGAFRETTDDVRSTSECSRHSHSPNQNQDLKNPVTSLSSVIGLEDKNIPSPAIVSSAGGVLGKDTLSSKECLAGKRFHESLNTSSDQDSVNNASTKESVSDKKSPESFSSFNGHDRKNRLPSKESALVADNKNSNEPFKSIISDEFKESVDSSKRSSLEAMVKDTISAEFSDNDDLGCPSDLVVDEQKAGDSSENEEDETDAALRKKINAIAEKEDETDDTEADSGRASDMSCPARCEEDMGSPMATDQVPATTTNVVTSHQHHSKSNNIDNVIKQLYLQHEIGRSPSSPKPAAATGQQQQPPQRDDLGALDLSTCTRKPGESPVPGTRPRAVANPVLDIKHRQQTYMPAPVRQHTACVPTPKHPTSSSLLMHQLTAHPPSILQAQLTAKAPHSHHHSPVPYSPYPLPNSNSRTVSSPSPLPGRPSAPSYSYRFAHQNAAAMQQQVGSVNLLAGMLPYASMNSIAGLAARAAALRPSSTTSSHRKDVSSPPTSSSANKMPSSSTSFSSHMGRHAERKSWGSTSSSRKLSEALLAGAPNCRGSAGLPTSPTGVPAHPRTSPSMLRLSPHHRSASPAPSPHSISNNISSSSSPSTIAALPTSTSSSQSKQSVPIFKKSDSFKGFNKFKRSANLAVFNPDPNGVRQKLVIKNLDFRSNFNSNHHHH